MRVFLTMMLLLALPNLACAHAVGVSCKIRGDKVEVEGYFDDDSPTAKATVQVVNARDEVIVSGVTDKEGMWTFTAPPPGKYEVRLDAGAGHRAKKTLIIPGNSSDPETMPEQNPDTESAVTERAEFTRIPWLGAAIGLAIIAGLGGAFVLASILRRSTAANLG